MKVASLIARMLLGLIFLAVGLNGFLHFVPAPPLTGMAADFFNLLIASKYYVLIFAVQIIGAVLLLMNRYVPLALVLLGPVIVNILAFHTLMDPPRLPMAIVVTALWLILFFKNKRHFEGIFAQRQA